MHAENGGVIDELVKEALRKGETAPKYHALTRPPRAEGEAPARAIALAEIARVPIYIVHLSAAHALEKVREARDMGLPAYAEPVRSTLFLSYDNYEEPGFTAPSTSCRRRFARSGTRTCCGRGSRRTTCR
jgi:dihydropyrimidinase